MDVNPAVFIVAVVIGVAVGWWIGRVRGRPALGAVLGLLGLLGWIIMWLIPARPGQYGDGVETDLDPHHTERPPDLPEGTLPPGPNDAHRA